MILALAAAAAIGGTYRKRGGRLGARCPALRLDDLNEGRERFKAMLWAAYPASCAASGVSQSPDYAKAPTSASNPSARPAGGPDRPIPVEVHQPNPSPLELAQRVLYRCSARLRRSPSCFVFAIFILLQQEDLRDRLIRLFGSGDLHRTTVALDDAGHRLSRYFLTQLSVNTAFGCVIAAGLFFIGIPSPMLWGIMGGLLRFVPYVGAFLAAGLPLVLAAAIDPGWAWWLGQPRCLLSSRV